MRRVPGYRKLIVRPVTVEFQGLNVTQIETSYTFHEKHGEVIDISRKIVGLSDPAAKVEIDEFITACWGTREYPEDFNGCTLAVIGRNGKRNAVEYAYHCREHSAADVAAVEALIPMVQTRIRMTPKAGLCPGLLRGGILLRAEPQVGLCRELGLNEELVTAFTIERAS